MTPEPAAFQASDPPPGGSLVLLTIPFIFTQDELLTTGDFLQRAKERGYNLTLDGLQTLHNHRLLVPFYRVSDTRVRGRRIEVEPDGGQNARGWTLQAAADGRLRDSAEEGYSAAWPYIRPPDEDARRWWNGFIFSSWQLLELRDVLNEYEWAKLGRGPSFHAQRRQRARRLDLALAVLATRYLPAALGRLRMPLGVEEEGLRRFRAKQMSKSCFDLLALMRPT